MEFARKNSKLTKSPDFLKNTFIYCNPITYGLFSVTGRAEISLWVKNLGGSKPRLHPSAPWSPK